MVLSIPMISSLLSTLSSQESPENISAICTGMVACCGGADIKSAILLYIKSNPGDYKMVTNNVIRCFCKILERDKAILLKMIKEIEKTKKNQVLVNELKLSLLRSAQTPVALNYSFHTTQDNITNQISASNPLLNKHDRILHGYKNFTVAQLNCIIIDLVNGIDLNEFQNCNWTKHEKRILAPSIMRTIDFYNLLSNRLAAEVTMVRDLVKRKRKICKIISLAQKALEFHNFELVSILVSTLQSCAVSRLKLTWATMSKKYMNIFDELNLAVSPMSNYSDYRSRISDLQQNKLSYVPIISVILRDVVAINESISQGAPAVKFQGIGNALVPIYNLRVNSIPLHSNETYQSFLNNLVINFPPNENHLLTFSYTCEPPKDARLLDLSDMDLEVFTLSEDSESSTSVSKSAHERENINDDRDSEILHQSFFKKPSMWSSKEVSVNVKSWDVPADVHKLLETHLVDGKSLLQFKPTPDIVPFMGTRKLLSRKIKQLHNQELLMSTYGSASSVYRSLSLRNSPRPLPTFKDKFLEWLKKSDYAQFESAFKNVTDAELNSITNEHLVKLGVTLIGPRKGILRGLAQLHMRYSQ